jgi:hypothetical protein
MTAQVFQRLAFTRGSGDADDLALGMRDCYLRHNLRAQDSMRCSVSYLRADDTHQAYTAGGSADDHGLAILDLTYVGNSLRRSKSMSLRLGLRNRDYTEPLTK